MITFKITVKQEKSGQVKVEMKPKGRNPTDAEKRCGGLINRAVHAAIKSGTPESVANGVEAANLS